MRDTLNELMGELLVNEPLVEGVLRRRKGLFKGFKARKGRFTART